MVSQRAFGIKRMVRDGDFRASGSGIINFDPNEIPMCCVEIAFKVAEAFKAQSVALDFVFKENNPLIVEMSYAYSSSAYWNCPGYWDRNGFWINGSFRAEDFVLEDLLASNSRNY